MENHDIWETLLDKAREQYHPHDLSPFFYANHVACALESGNGDIFTGFCIEGASGVLNLCAERVAAVNMIVNSDQTFIRRILVMRDRPPFEGGSFLPCGACREFLLQLDIRNAETEILVDFDLRKTVRVSDLLPFWWGTERYKGAD